MFQRVFKTNNSLTTVIFDYSNPRMPLLLLLYLADYIFYLDNITLHYLVYTVNSRDSEFPDDSEGIE